MNWMIDGAYGDWYRIARNCPPLAPAADEWEAERRLGAKPPRKRHPVRACFRLLRRSLARQARPHHPDNHAPVMEGFVS